MTNEELLEKIEQRLRILTPNCELQFEVELVGHCNLNCKCCNHYSPLVQEEYCDINEYKKDCDRLSELFKGEMSSVYLMGGEPLLHPQVTEFMRVTREAFPIGEILLVTNGLLLPTMPEGFWEACKKYDILLSPTCYPVKFDYIKLKKIVDSKGVKYAPFSMLHESQDKVLIRTNNKIHVNRRLDAKRHFFNCRQALDCVTLKNGKMYPCATAAHASRLKKYFNLNIHLSEKDGVDIYAVKSGDDLFEKLSRPVPFCKYCDITDKRIACDFGISRKDRYEWLSFEFTEDDIQYLKTEKPVVYIFGAGELGTRTVTLLKDLGIMIKSVLATRKKQCIDDILGVPIVILNELGEVEPNSICLVALESPIHKSEVYPILSKMGFGDVVPVFGV